MDLNLTFFTWNCQGCASPKFIRAFREYKRDFNPDIMCLLELRVSGKKANDIINKLGLFYSHRVEAVGFSRGIWVGWKESIRINIIHNHPQFMLLKVHGILDNNHLYVSFVYGSPDRNKRKSLWTTLKNAIPLDSSPCLFMGDFNVILSADEKKSSFGTGKRCKYFGDFVDSCQLHDLGFTGPSYIWHRAGTFE